VDICSYNLPCILFETDGGAKGVIIKGCVFVGAVFIGVR